MGIARMVTVRFYNCPEFSLKKDDGSYIDVENKVNTSALQRTDRRGAELRTLEQMRNDVIIFILQKSTERNYGMSRVGVAGTETNRE